MTSTTVSSQIEEAEATLHIRLPESFRRYLLEVEPSDIEIAGLMWDVNPVPVSPTSESTQHRVSAIVLETMNAREWEGFPDGAVAVGSDGYGNYLVFLPGDLHHQLGNKLYVWWHEGPELELVSNDFAEVVPRSNRSLDRTRGD